jgi:hypothetical protein
MIKMIRGVFGLPVNGIVKAMDKNSGPFEAGAEQEARLIRLGLAVRVETGETAPVEEPAETVDTDAPIGFDETPPDDFDEAEAVEEIVDLNSISAKELRAIGKQYGLTFKVGTTKDDMVAAITNAQAEAVEVEDGEPAPEFDAAEAVL